MNLKVLGQLHQRKIAPAPTLTLTLNQTLTLTGGVNVLRGQLSGLQHSYFRVNKITSFEEHLRTDASIRCYLDTINLKQSGCGTTCSFKIQNKNIKIISKLVNLKKNILQFSCNVYVMFYYEISWFYQHVKSGNLWFLNMYSVHGAKILDLSLEIMLSPSEGRITNLYNSNGFSFIPEQV